MEGFDRTTVAFVTGASRGIGRLLALSLAETGAAVIGFARASDALDSLAVEAGPGSQVHTYPLDVAEPDDVRVVFERVVRDVGVPTVLVTCARSLAALGPISSIDPDRWWRDVTVTLRGTMLCVQAVLGPMLEAGSGHIVTVYGNLGDHGQANVSGFAASKAGIARFTETLANELAATGVVPLAMHPGFVRTATTEDLAWSDQGQQWLPEFRSHAERNWGDGTPAVKLLERILDGEADELAGRVIHVNDNLGRLTENARADEDLRRLRLRPAE